MSRTEISTNNHLNKFGHSILQLPKRYPRELVLVLGFLFFLPRIIAGSGGGSADPEVDSSWFIGMVTLGKQGDWLGRDLFFSYGPVSQLISLVAGSSFRPDATAYDTFSLGLMTFGILGLITALIILWLIKELTWRQLSLALFIGFVTDIFTTWYFYRNWALVLLVVLFARTLARPSSRRQLGLFGLLGLAALFVQLITAELGIYALATFGLTLLFFSLAARFKWLAYLQPARHYLFLLTAFLGGYSLANLILSLFFKLTSANYQGLFDYQLYTWEGLTGYNYTMPFLWEPGLLTAFILFGLLGLLSLWIGWRLRHYSPAYTYLVIPLLTLSLVHSKSSLIRSDSGHVAQAFIPAIVLLMALGSNLTPGWRNWQKAGWTIVLIVVVLGWPGQQFSNLKAYSDILSGKSAVISQLNRYLSRNTPPGAVEPKNLAADLDHSKTLLGFPYQNYIGIVNREKITAPVLQSYAAHTEALQQFYVEALERQKNNLEIVYGIDRLGTVDIDAVQTVAREPLIFDYIYRNFELKTPTLYGPNKEYLLLKPRPQPEDDRFYEPLRFTQDPVVANLWTFRLVNAAACSFLRITPVIKYPLWSLLGRPAGFHLNVFSKGNRIENTDLVAISPGKAFTTYIQLVDPRNFQPIFDTQPVQQKVWDTLQISVKDSRFGTVYPSSLDITEIECVNMVR